MDLPTKRGGSGSPLEVVQQEGSLVPDKEGWKLYLVQEICLTSLANALEVGALMPFIHETGVADLGFLEDALNVLVHVASGLAYLHGKGIIHGDLKPDNIMLKQQNGKVVAKLTDFGLSETLGPEATHVSNYCAGTPYYIAPEVLHSKIITTASDMYSFGTLAWQTLTAQPPYVVKPGKIMARNPLFPALPQPAYPSPIPELVHKCLRQDPKQRPTASEMVLRLTGVLQTLKLLLHEGPGKRGAKPSTSGVSQATNAMETLGYTGAVAPSGLRAELDLRKASGSMSVAGAGTENRLEPVLEGSEERVMGSKCGSSGSRLISFVKSQLFQGETEEQGHEQASK